MAWPKGVPRGQGTRTPGSGRKAGTPNRVTAKTREIFTQVLGKTAQDMEAWLRECAQGIEIEKQDPTTGMVVTGRFNADPGKAVELILKLAEFSFPKLARIERTIADATDQELLQEVRRRRMEADRMRRDPALQAAPEVPALTEGTMEVGDDGSTDGPTVEVGGVPETGDGGLRVRVEPVAPGGGPESPAVDSPGA